MKRIRTNSETLQRFRLVLEFSQQQLRPLRHAIEPTLMEQSMPSLIQLLLRNLDLGDRLADHHLFHQGLEQAEANEQGPTLNADRSRQLRNHRSAIHVSHAMGEN